MATHPSILAWVIPWTEEPGGLQEMGSQRVGHDSATNTHTHRLGLPAGIQIRKSPSSVFLLLIANFMLVFDVAV